MYLHRHYFWYCIFSVRPCIGPAINTSHVLLSLRTMHCKNARNTTCKILKIHLLHKLLQELHCSRLSLAKLCQHKYKADYKACKNTRTKTSYKDMHNRGVAGSWIWLKSGNIIRRNVSPHKGKPLITRSSLLF